MIGISKCCFALETLQAYYTEDERHTSAILRTHTAYHNSTAKEYSSQLAKKKRIQFPIDNHLQR
jgi:hypothetical protein